MPGGGLEFACEKPKDYQESPEHILKTLQNMETNEEKLAALCKKYTELLEEHRTMQNTIKQNQRTITVLSREKDQLQSEHSKAVLAKSRLEGLCRELQKHNKLIKDESTARAKEDEERRKEISAKFQTTINEIQQQMNDHYQKNTSLREENLELANKLKEIIKRYELREGDIEKILEMKKVEGQLYDAKLQQAALQLAEEKEKSLQDKQKLLQEIMEAQKRIALLEHQEEQLKTQLNLYSEKYEDFQSTLSKSSSVFESFKSEMEKMTKKIKKLEKETTTWRQKWESSNKALLVLAEEKSLSQKEVSLLQNKVGKLESLCRALQEERRKNGSATDASSSRLPVEAKTEDPSEKVTSSDSAVPSSSDATSNPDSSSLGLSSEPNPVLEAPPSVAATCNSQQLESSTAEVQETVSAQDAEVSAKAEETAVKEDVSDCTTQPQIEDSSSPENASVTPDVQASRLPEPDSDERNGKESPVNNNSGV